jgi:teichuronic acid biosynthesis glycosyltransferase TuaG
MKKPKTPKISVCIPAHNAELWLAQAIQSIIGQSFEDWEIVCVDDSSTDTTAKIIEFYAKELGNKFKGVNQLSTAEEPAGIAFTRNMANVLATGEIICVQDADDMSHKDRLKNTWGFFKRHKAVDLIYGHCQYIDALNRPYHMIHAEPFDFERLKVENWIHHPTVAYRRKAVLDVPYRADCKVIDDWFLYYDFYKAGKKIAPLPEVLAFYRSLPSGVSRNPEKEKLITEMKEKFLAEANNESVGAVGL